MSSKPLANQNINYEKAINKAINNPDMEVKEKHVRLVIMGTFSEKGSEMFWRVALGFPYMYSKAVALKLCYVLHKVLREGHSLCCYHSQSHKTDLERIGEAWYHSDEDFAEIIKMYTKLLAAKLEFHFRYPDFPGHLNATLSELQLIVKNDMNDYFQLSVDILEYLNHVIQFQETVFQSPLHTILGKKNSKCALALLDLSIQEASQLYNHCVRILFILHSSLPTESLQGHRIRFGEQFRRLKVVYFNAKMFHMITVPSLPEKAPNFFIEANLPSHINLESLSCIKLVDNTAINSSQNMLKHQIAIPKSNGFVEHNLIDLSDSPPFHEINHLRSTADCGFLPASHQMRMENMATQNATVLILPQEDLVDPFDTSFLEFAQQSTEQPPLSPVIHQMYIENMIAQQSKADGNSFRSLSTSSHTPLLPISYRLQPEWRSTRENSIDPFYNPSNNFYNGYLNTQMKNTVLQRSNSTEGIFANQFEYNGDYRPSAPPLFNTVTDHQIHVEAIIERDNHIQYLQHELEKLRQQKYPMKSDNFKNFQEKVTSLEKSLFAKENKAVQENKINMLINQVPRSLQYRSERSSSVLENNNSENVFENIEERQSIIGNLKTQDEQVEFAFQTTSSDSDWDDEDEIDEIQNGIENLELEYKIRDIEQQIDLHMKNKDLAVWNNNQELFNIKAEILKMSLENLIKEKQADAAESEEKAKNENLVNRKFKKFTSFLKDKRMKLK